MNKSHSSACLVFFALLLLTSMGQLPETSAADYDGTICINGAVTNPLTITRAQFIALPTSRLNATLDCDGTLIFDGEFEGVSIAYLLNLAGASPDATDLKFRASDGYEVPLSIAEALKIGAIIAYSSPSQGDSPQLVLPGSPGYFWIRMITEIEVIAIPKSTAPSPTLPNSSSSEPTLPPSPPESGSPISAPSPSTSTPSTMIPTKTSLQTPNPTHENPSPLHLSAETQPKNLTAPSPATDGVRSQQLQTSQNNPSLPWITWFVAVAAFVALSITIGVIIIGHLKKRE